MCYGERENTQSRCANRHAAHTGNGQGETTWHEHEATSTLSTVLSGGRLRVLVRQARLHPARDLLHYPPSAPVIDRVERHRSFAATGEDSGLPEKAEMVRGVLMGKPNAVGKLLNPSLPAIQSLKQGNALCLRHDPKPLRSQLYDLHGKRLARKSAPTAGRRGR